MVGFHAVGGGREGEDGHDDDGDDQERGDGPVPGEGGPLPEGAQTGCPTGPAPYCQRGGHGTLWPVTAEDWLSG